MPQRPPSIRVYTSSSSSSTSSSATSSTAGGGEANTNSNQSGLQQLVSGSIPWNQLVGQADRAFRLGIQLEKNGQARKASAAFHEAATLYQCFIDSKQTSEFHHVTFLSLDDVPAILAYTCTRLGFLNLDALGDPRAAVRLYKEAATVDPYPSRVSYEGMAQSLEASGGGRSLRAALECYRTALQMHPGNRETQFHLAVVLDRLGGSHEQEEAQALFEQLRREEAQYACLVDSWGYLRWHTRKIPCDDLNLHRGTRDMLEIAIVAAMPLIEQGGLVAEFGVGYVACSSLFCVFVCSQSVFLTFHHLCD
jgi:tetratricopeptide (TPR) repeat protein